MRPLATRGTPRGINRRIALDLIRTRQPVSRADLARLMGTRRGAVTLLVNELIREGSVFEGATGETRRGRKPTFLFIDSRKRFVVAVDIRATRTFIMVTDLVGRQLAGVTSFPTERDRSASSPACETRQVVLVEHKDFGRCQGVGSCVPGMVASDAGARPARAQPGLAQRESARSDCRRPRSAGADRALRQGLRARAALGHGRRGHAPGNFVYVNVSDGLGVGVVVGGELIRGQHNIAGEFGHVPLNLDGPRCGCGATGRWEAYVSNFATLSRYFGRDLRERPIAADAAALTVDELIARARNGDAKALATLLSRRLVISVSVLARWSTPSIRRSSTSAEKSRRPGI